MSSVPTDLPVAPELPGKAVGFEILGPVADADRAWALIGDTDWLNRLGGNGAVLSQDMEGDADGLPVLRGAIAGPAGLQLPYEEAWTSWVKGRWFRQIRTVQSPLLHATDYFASLRPEGDGVRPVIKLELYGSGLARPVLAASLRPLQAKWQQALDGLAGTAEPVRTLPLAAVDALRRWEESTSPELVAKARWMLEHASPTELRRLRPFALADRWGLDRDETLDGFMQGVLAGAFELYWSVSCVRCYGQVGGGGSLSDIADHAACPSCRVEFDNDLGTNVEVLLTPHPAVVERVEERFCTMYPAGAPEHLAVWTLGPGEALETELDLPLGEHHLGPGGEVADTRLEVSAEGADSVEWRATAPELHASLGQGGVKLSLANDAPGRVRVQLTRDSGQDPKVHASVLSTRPLFQRSFGHQVLAPNLRLSTRAVTLLFTDLSGSTALYESIGDAAAFAVVRDHFTVLREVIEGSNGVVVKTIGDAVMAAFDTPARATRSALSMQRAFAEWAATLDMEAPPGLKIGIHVGPALAVQSDLFGLDWFGGTVNLAARAESLATRGDVILSEAAAGDSGVVQLLAAEEIVPEPLERTVKGFHGTLHFVRLRPHF